MEGKLNSDLIQKYKDDYFTELSHFINMINVNYIKLNDLDNIISKCLKILIKKKKDGFDYAVIKTSNEKFRTACKFIQYFYGYKTEQDREFEDLNFTCCQYRLYNYDIKKLLNSFFKRSFLDNDSICKCNQKILDDKRINIISTDEFTNKTNYRITIEQISFKFIF